MKERLFLFLGALALRLPGMGAEFEAAHPDETALVWNALSIAAGDPNPHDFLYPSFFRYLCAAAAVIAHAASEFIGAVPEGLPIRAAYFFSDAPFFLACRLVTQLMGAATVCIVFETARALHGTRAGLAAALFSLAAPLLVVHSGRATTDAPMAFFVLASLGFCCAVARGASWRAYVAAGVCAGLAAGTKYPGALACAALAGAHVAARGWRGFPLPLVAAAAASVAAFLASTPFSVLAFHEFRFGLSGAFLAARDFPLPEHEGPDLLFYPIELFRSGMTPPLALLSVAGAATALARGDRAARLLALFSLAFLAYMGTYRNQNARFVVAVVPALCILAGAAVGRIRRRSLSAGVFIAALAPALFASVALQSRILQGSTRLAAARFVSANVPSGARVLREPGCGFLPSLERTAHFVFLPEVVASGHARLLLERARRSGKLFRITDTRVDAGAYAFDSWTKARPDFVLVSAPSAAQAGQFPQSFEGPRNFYRFLAAQGTRVAHFPPGAFESGGHVSIWRLPGARSEKESERALADAVALWRGLLGGPEVATPPPAR